MPAPLRIAPARPEDVPQLLAMIRELAEFEHLAHLLECDEPRLQAALFGPQPCIEALLGWVGATAPQAVAYTICFRNFSTFLGRPGLYLEDLYVRPAWRHRGYARQMLAHLAGIAVSRGCGRFEWSVLDWNTTAQDLYRALGAEILPDWRITRLTGDALARLAGSQLGMPLGIQLGAQSGAQSAHSRRMNGHEPAGAENRCRYLARHARRRAAAGGHSQGP